MKQKEETTFLSQKHLHDNRPQMEDESVNESSLEFKADLNFTDSEK